MKILSAYQIRLADAHTIANEPIDSIDLMERASQVFVDWFMEHYDRTNPVHIFCGPGNNGGDGLAIARLLYNKEFKVNATLVQFGKGTSKDYDTNLKRLKAKTYVVVQAAKTTESLPEIKEDEIVIDAILGSGLSRPASGFFKQVIQFINKNANKVVCVDIPSGLFSDTFTDSEVVRGSRTLSFERPKLAFFLPSNAERVGDWDYRSIGLEKDYMDNMVAACRFISADEISKIYRKRKKFDHKGSFGHSLLIAGSHGKIGAAVLAAQGALRAGTGLLTVCIPKCGYAILQTVVPEAMAITDKKENEITGLPDLKRYKAIGIGPGLGESKSTASAINQLIESSKQPLVLDADALNILAKNPDWIIKLPKKSILTPHPKEFERLFGKSENDFDRMELLQERATALNIYIILKGAHTAIACPNETVWFNATGNPGMGTGGSGDVLTGVLTGLLAQGYTPFETVLLGVYLHGLAGDIASRDLSEEALIAGDLANYLGKAFLEIKDGNH